MRRGLQRFFRAGGQVQKALSDVCPLVPPTESPMRCLRIGCGNYTE
jgi:hypothetical protein